MRGFRVSKLHAPPLDKIKVRRRYYKTMLLIAALAIWYVHEHHHEYEMHSVFVANLLFICESIFGDVA